MDRVLDTLAALATLLMPSPLPRNTVGDAGGWPIVAGRHWRRLRGEPTARLDGWSAQHIDRPVSLEAGAPAAVAGDTLLHLDLRADNMLLTPDRVLVVDWLHARVGVPWVDLAFFAPA